MKRILLTALLCLVPLSAWGQPELPILADIPRARPGDREVIDGKNQQRDGVTQQRIAAKHIENFRGVGAVPDGPTPEVADCNIRFCTIGIKVRWSDTILRDNREVVAGDYGLWITNPNGVGAVKSINNHYYGHRIAAAWNEHGQGFQSMGDNFSDAPIGLHCGPRATATRVIGAQSIHCWNTHFICESDVHFADCIMDVWRSHDWVQGETTLDSRNIIGCDWRAQGSTWRGGNVRLDWFTNPHHEAAKHRPARCAFRLAGAHWALIDTNVYGIDKFGGQTVVLVDGENHGGTFTLIVGGLHDPGDAVIRVTAAGKHSRGLTFVVQADSRHAAENILTTEDGWHPSNKVIWRNVTTGVEVPVWPDKY